MPSRQFLVTQAVLNAAAKRMPLTVQAAGAARALLWLTYLMDGERHPGYGFTSDIHAEFHKLAQQYEVVA